MRSIAVLCPSRRLFLAWFEDHGEHDISNYKHVSCKDDILGREFLEVIEGYGALEMDLDLKHLARLRVRGYTSIDEQLLYKGKVNALHREFAKVYMQEWGHGCQFKFIPTHSALNAIVLFPFGDSQFFYEWKEEQMRDYIKNPELRKRFKEEVKSLRA